MNQTQKTAAKWDKIWTYLKEIGCRDQLGIPQEESAIDFIKSFEERNLQPEDSADKCVCTMAGCNCTAKETMKNLCMFKRNVSQTPPEVQADDESKPSKPEQPIIEDSAALPTEIPNLREALGMKADADWTFVKWSDINNSHILYTGCTECNRAPKVIRNAVGLAAWKQYQVTKVPILIADGSQPYDGDCFIKHQGAHRWDSGTFDIQIPNYQERITRIFNPEFHGQKPLNLWIGNKLQTDLIAWRALYLFVKYVHSFSSQSQWQCLLYPEIRSYVLLKVEAEYGRDARREAARFLYEEVHHKNHIHIAPGRVGKTWDSNLDVSFEI